MALALTLAHAAGEAALFGALIFGTAAAALLAGPAAQAGLDLLSPRARTVWRPTTPDRMLGSPDGSAPTRRRAA